MGLLVRLVCGEWTKNDDGEWIFHKDSSQLEHFIVARTNEPFDSFDRLVREELLLPSTKPMFLTFRLEDSLTEIGSMTVPPHVILTNENVEFLMSIHEWKNDVCVFVTHGAMAVAKTQFLYRSPFTIGDTTYLAEGITEEEHLEALNDAAEEDEIKCNGRVLRQLFTEEKLVLVYRFSFELEKAKQMGESKNNRLNPKPKDVLRMRNVNKGNVANAIEGEEMDEGCSMKKFMTNELNERHSTWKSTFVGQMNGETEEWESDDFEGCVDIINLSSDLNLGDDVSPMCEVEYVDIEGSSTGSTAAVKDFTYGNTDTRINWPEEDRIHNTRLKYPFRDTKNYNEEYGIDENFISIDSDGDTSNQRGMNSYLRGDDSFSSSGGNYGVAPDSPDDLYVGKVFKNRDEFKQHMAIYAIRNKFRFTTTRSAPGKMVLKCFSSICKWRVYAVILKNTELFEIRKVNLQHSCSVDARSGYQSQATHAVIGGMMKAKFSGRGGGPTPSEIMQAMSGDHDVHISYWKAWRSREVALDYAKGSAGASYNLLPAYLEKLVASNPGTLADIQTESSGGIENRFKYMFLAMGGSIEGFKYMRRVVVVDGTHLRGKYAGCLLTASAQDGNYQVFPLAVAVVDGENDKAWEWFFKKLILFIPNNEDVVFVSDRHPSIYYAIAKVYPRSGHCACILHLKRNIKTYFKDKHLGFLLGKAARSFRVSEFNSAFKEIELVNASCAEYLSGIGFPHWARAHFNGDRYNIMTSNVAETWNAVLREAREFPILPFIEFIRSKLMSWFSGRRQLQCHGDNHLTPRVQDIVKSNFDNCGMFQIHVIATDQYQVKDKQGFIFHVDLSLKTCSCNEFQALKIPCTHAVAAATRFKVPVETLVAPFYTISTYTAAYSAIIAPVLEDQRVQIISSDTSDSQVSVNPPASRRPPGRPKKNRFLSRGEFQRGGAKKRTLCSRCKSTGHNRATCKAAI